MAGGSIVVASVPPVRSRREGLRRQRDTGRWCRAVASASATGAWGDHGARRDRRAIRPRDSVADRVRAPRRV